MPEKSNSQKLRQSHGLDQEQMADIQINQQQSADVSEIKMVKASKKRQDGTAYELPEHEKHLVHVELETPSYDRLTGQKLSRPRTQTFYQQEFDAMEREGAFDGMTVEILHSPAGWKRAKEVKKNLEAQAEGAPPIPKVVSEPGAGTPLLDILAAKTEKQLREVHKSLYPEVDNSQLSKEDLQADIRDRVGDWGKEADVTLRETYNNQLKAAGLPPIE